MIPASAIDHLSLSGVSLLEEGVVFEMGGEGLEGDGDREGRRWRGGAGTEMLEWERGAGMNESEGLEWGAGMRVRAGTGQDLNIYVQPK